MNEPHRLEAIEDEEASTGFRCARCGETVIWQEGQGFMHAEKVGRDDLIVDWSRSGEFYEPLPPKS